jgi:hypothetical protein
VEREELTDSQGLFHFMTFSEHRIADNVLAVCAQQHTRRRRMKHIKKVTVIKTIMVKANVFDDIGNWFQSLGDNHKIKW